MSFALNSAARESYKCTGRSTGECCCSSLHSDSLVLVPVSLPRDESNCRLEKFLAGIDKGLERSIDRRDVSSLRKAINYESYVEVESKLNHFFCLHQTQLIKFHTQNFIWLHQQSRED